MTIVILSGKFNLVNNSVLATQEQVRPSLTLPVLLETKHHHLFRGMVGGTV